MANFCTLFDANYLPRALVLYRSLVATAGEFTLFALCMDEVTHRILSRLRLPHVEVISLAEFETPPLKSVKATRSTAEYCWTCTPHVVRFVLDKWDLPEATYLDADLQFLDSPSVLLGELHDADGSVLITPHRYTPRYDQSATSGIYCVQFVTFRRDDRAMRVLDWWQDACLDWCYARSEPGRYGDQKYLDDWPQRFEGIHVLRHLGGGVAPWNVQQYRLWKDEAGLHVDGQRLVFFHFQDLRCFDDGTHDYGQYRLAPEVVDLIYRPYVDALGNAREEIRAIDPGFPHGWTIRPGPLARTVRSMKRLLRG